MKTKTLTGTMGVVLLIAGGLCWTGCGRNEAQDADSSVLPAEPDVAAATQVELAEREEVIAAREAELAERELLAAEAERRLAQRVEPLEAPPNEPEPEDREPVEDTFPFFEPEPEPEPEPVARTVLVTLQTATPVEVEFTDPLSSETNVAGDGVRATVVRDVFADGLVAIPAGSKVLGTVVSSETSKKIGGQARMTLSFDRMDLPSGEIVTIQSFLDLTGKNQNKKDAATIGGSAAGGAILGRVLSKKKSKGTAIGAILGAAVGAAVASENKSDPVVVEPGMLAEVTLESPVQVAVLVDPAEAVASNR